MLIGKTGRRLVQPHRSPRERSAWSRRVAVVAGITLVALGALAGGCSKKKTYTYSQQTPQDVLDSLMAMIKNGDVKNIPDLIYADSKEYRLVLNRFGSMLERLGEVSAAVAQRFPNETAELKKKFQEIATPDGIAKLSGAAAEKFSGFNGSANKPAAAPIANQPTTKEDDGKLGIEVRVGGISRDGKTGPAIEFGNTPPANAPNPGGLKIDLNTKPKSAGIGGGGVGGGGVPPFDEGMLRDLSTQLFADPLGLMEASFKRLSVVKTADDEAAVLFDGRPVPPLGLLMKKENDAWFIVLPVQAPMLAQFMPETRSEWSIMGSLIKSIDNALADLRDDIKAGKVANVNQLAEKVGEKAFIPGAIVFVAYAKEMDVRMQRQAAMAKFNKRLDTWAVERVRQGERKELTDKVVDLVQRCGREGLDKLIREKIADSSKKMVELDKVSDGELSLLIDSFVSPRGYKTSMGTIPADERQVDSLLEKFKAGVNVQK